MTRVTLLLVGLAVAATIALLIATGDGKPWQAIAAVAMIGVAPYMAFTALARWARGTPLAEMATLGGLVLALAFAVGIYSLAFWLQPGPRSPQAVVGVPLLQSIALAFAGAGTSFAKWRENRR